MMMRTLLSRRVLLVLFAVFCVVPVLKAQTGSFTGRITSVDGASVPGIQISVTNEGTAATHQTQTNQDGLYTVPALDPGVYTIEASGGAFARSVHKGLRLDVEQNLRLDIVLQLASVSSTVTVTGETPILQTETSSVGQIVSGREVLTLPLLGRDAYALGELVPGVRSSAGMNQLPVDVISTSSVSINGAQSTANDFLLDGAPNSAPSINQPVVYPIADTVQEFRLQTNNYSAEFGRAAGGIFDVVTKGGTNSVHFGAYEFYRNDTLAANNWFSKAAGQQAPPLSFNQFGGYFGGPVVLPHVYNGHNKTFVFFGTEFVRFTQGVTFTGSVPNPTKLTGNFSNDVNAAGNKITIYDPLSGSSARTAFAGDIIPASRLNPVAVAMAKYFPKPNHPNPNGTDTSNYINSTTNQIREDEYSIRADHNLSDRTSMFGRYSWNNTNQVRPNAYGAGNLGGPAFGPQEFDRKNAVVQVTHTFSSSLLGVARFSGARLTNRRGPASLGFDISQLGFPSGLAQQIGPPASFPFIGITGISVTSSVPNTADASALGGTGMIAGFLNTTGAGGSLVKTWGRHTTKTGIDLRLMRANIEQVSDNGVNFNFNAGFTQGPIPTQASATAGDAVASFLLGTPASANVTPAIAVSIQTKYSAVFLQDDWKVTNDLTLNLGLRYEYETPFTERHNRLANFAPEASVPLTGVPNLHGALIFPGANGLNRYDSTAYADHVEPRLGFAWHATPTSVIHGGGGLFYATLWGAGEAPQSYGTASFTAATSMVTTLNGTVPINTLSNPYPTGLNAATGSSLGNATLLGQVISVPLRTQKTPYAVQWNFGIQQQLARNLSMDLMYVGTEGHHEPGNVPLNQLPTADLALGKSLNDQLPNPFYGQIKTGALSFSTVSRGQLLRPYPQFLDITGLNVNRGSSRFNALEATLQRHYANGFSLQLAYTWSKMMDQGAGSFTGEALGGGAIQDFYNLGAEMSISAPDQTHRLVGSIIYMLPFFHEERGLRGHLLGGWTVSFLPSFISGGPLGVASANNTTGSLGGGQRPDWNGKNPALAHRSVARWFDTSDFSVPAAFKFGSSPRTFSFLRSDWTRNIDASLQKNIKLPERLNGQLRIDAFNLNNTPHFAPPNVSFGTPSFGVVSAQQNQPRTIQFVFRLSY